MGRCWPLDNCALPATGGSTTGLIVIAAVAIIAGACAIRLARHRAVPIVLAMCVALGVAGWAQPARAATDCPTTTAAATTSPTTTAATTSTTAPDTTVLPAPQNDFYTVAVGASGSGNIV